MTLVLFKHLLLVAFLYNVVHGNFVQEVVRKHNELRLKHGASPLKLDKKLSEQAQVIAQQFAKAKKIEDEPDDVNTFTTCGTSSQKKINGRDVTEAWYNSVCDKDFSFDNPNEESAKAFTKLVWKDSKLIGVGLSSTAKKDRNGNACKFVVAKYTPKSSGKSNNGDERTDGKAYQKNVAKGRFDDNYCTKILKGNRRQVFDQFAQDALSAHNAFRKLHGVPAMSLDEEMVKEATAYAKKIANLAMLKHAGSSDNPSRDGENLAMLCTTSDIGSYDGKEPVKAWYNEVCDPGYTFDPPTRFSGGTGHFTQVVWKKSKQLGIGKATARRDSMECVYTVARYRAPGNFMGEFESNVKKGDFTEDYCDEGKLDELLESKRSSQPSSKQRKLSKPHKWNVIEPLVVNASSSNQLE